MTLIFPASLTLLLIIILAIDFLRESTNPAIPLFSILVVKAASDFLYYLSKHSFDSFISANLALFFLDSLYYLSISSYSTKCSYFISLVKAEIVFY